MADNIEGLTRDGDEGAHWHIEHIPEEPYVAAGSYPITISLEAEQGRRLEPIEFDEGLVLTDLTGRTLLVGESVTNTIRHPSGSDPHWWKIPGSLRTCLLRLDSQVGAVVNVEKCVVDPAGVPDEVVGQLERIAQQMGLNSGNGVVGQLGSAPGFEPVKPGFTRVAGSFRRQVPPHGVGTPGE